MGQLKMQGPGEQLEGSPSAVYLCSIFLSEFSLGAFCTAAFEKMVSLLCQASEDGSLLISFQAGKV
jgi:hypothetical protein